MKIFVNKTTNLCRTLHCSSKKKTAQLTTKIVQGYFHAYYWGNKKIALQDNLRIINNKCVYPIKYLEGKGKIIFVAEDLSFAIFAEEYPKNFFATDESIRESNKKLCEVDSYVHLQKEDNSTIELKGHRDETIKLHKVSPVNIHANTKQNKMFIDICIEMAGFIAGTRSFYDNRIREGENRKPSHFDSLKSNEVNKLAKIISDTPKEQRGELIKKLHINQYASPDIGEAFSIMSYVTNENPLGGKWGYHFAGVVAKSSIGSDFITLENYNRSIEKEEIGGRKLKYDETNNKLTAWYFQIYGTKKDQSFHEKQEATNSYINPITVSVSKSNNTEEKNKWKDKFYKLYELTKELSIDFELYDNVLYTIDNNFTDEYIKALSYVYSYYVDKIKFKIELITEVINKKDLEPKQKAQFVAQTMNNDTVFRRYVYQLAYEHPNETKECAKSILNSKIRSLLSKGYTIDYMPFI